MDHRSLFNARIESTLATSLGEGPPLTLIIIPALPDDWAKPYFSGSTRVCAGLGCPICSAMACVLAISTGRPVSFEGDKNSPDGKTLESTYRLLEA